MNQDMINQLKELFNPIAQKIGESTNFGWEVVLRQQIIYGILNLMAVLVGIIIAIITYKLWKHFSEDSNFNFQDGRTGIIVIGSIISLGLIIRGLVFGIPYLLNPEYYAIQFFINLIK